MIGDYSERRKHKRYDLHIKFYAESLNKVFKNFSAETINISERGAFIKIPEDIELFERFNGMLEVPENLENSDIFFKIKFDGIIIRKEIRITEREKEYYAGIYFEKIEDKDLFIIKKFLNKFGEKNPFLKLLDLIFKRKWDIVY